MGLFGWLWLLLQDHNPVLQSGVFREAFEDRPASDYSTSADAKFRLAYLYDFELIKGEDFNDATFVQQAMNTTDDADPSADVYDPHWETNFDFYLLKKNATFGFN